ncbi:DUF6985 domain-containing protein [Rubellicoccus peritrichatus]|uniref:DUF6985 domain-containing protein n=1 Tax=Rubellicoccus peritrichatus TaxID=3080537 RepID=A0AAQ3LCT4_9BACT|nr:hypothetical protein [Puniceicoccus sp. CR14]WOO43121.1 hypothetical protein RZN69_08450 [Puniceicoccus sp. CR14]
MNHPIFGELASGVLGDAACQWETDPILIPNLKRKAVFVFELEEPEDWDDEEEEFIDAWSTSIPEEMLSCAEEIYNGSEEYFESVAKIIADHYMEFKRPYYLKSVDNPAWGDHPPKAEDFPAIEEPNQMWDLLKNISIHINQTPGIEGVIEPEPPEIRYSCATTFDVEHGYSVTFQNGELTEIVLDG